MTAPRRSQDQPPYDRMELRVDPVQPDAVRRMRDRETADEQGSGRWLAIVEILLAIALIALVILAGRSAAPRSGSLPLSPADAVQTGAPDPDPYGDGGDDAGAPLTLDPRIGREGRITHMGRGGWPVEYLAIPLGPGHRVEICGPAACRVMVSTDAGPNRERILAGVIADVSWQRFETLCGVPASYGGCPGSWTVTDAITRQPLEGGRMTLPPTDVAP